MVATAPEANTLPDAPTGRSPGRTARALRHAVPRLIAGAAMPAVCFVVGRAQAGLIGAIVAAMAWGVGYQLFLLARGRRWSVLAALSLAELVVRSGTALALGSTTAFFIVPSIVTAAMGGVYVVSCLAGRPLLGLVADEVLPSWLVDPASLRTSRVLRRASVAYGVEQILIATLSIVMALALPPTQYVTFHPPVSWSVFWSCIGIFALTLRPPHPEAISEHPPS